MKFDVAACVAGLKHLESQILGAAHQLLGQTASLAANQARGSNDFKDRTGKLRASIVRIERNRWHFLVRAGAKHAAFIENGTRPHPIVARRARFLRFQVAGTTYFRRRVQHPGTVARHFMRDARDHAEAHIGRFVQAGMTRVING